jgi:SAM-dependent methyltransferase
MTRPFEGLTPIALAELDALLADADGSHRWDGFYADRAKPCVFFGTAPDESLARWVQDGALRPGRAIDLGCGNGRNAVFLAQQGFSVEAVDYSQAAIDWAHDRVAEAGVEVALARRNVFDLALEANAYDLVYDSGCFHHIAPHRRTQYVETVVRALKPGGSVGVTCFRPEGGSGYTDDEVYQRRSMGGGLGYTEERLRDIWSRGMQVRALVPMRKTSPASGVFGESFLWTLLAQKT